MVVVINDEVKHELVKKYYEGEPVYSIYTSTEVSKSAFYNWVKHCQHEKTQLDHIVSFAEFIKMKSHVKNLKV